MLSLTNIVRSVWPGARGGGSGDRLAVERVRQLAADLRGTADARLKQHVLELKQQVQQGTPPTAPQTMLPGFALVVEAARRKLGLSFYDVQLLAGLALARRTIAEMQTGEGKTLTGVLPAFLHALAGRGVHVMTVNAYLAVRDQQLLAPVFQLLGMTTGLLKAEDSPEQKRAAYARDVTFGPGYEFGFDYLRDQVALLKQPQRALGHSYRDLLQGQSPIPFEPCQREHAFAIVDEADSVMLDEASTPLILAEAAEQEAPGSAHVFIAAAEFADRLKLDEDYVVDQQSHTVWLTEEGTQRILVPAEQVPHDGLQRPWPAYVQQALRAKLLIRRDVEYVVADGKLHLVDENTGRIFAERTWRDGLQQAVQVRAGITITAENLPLARISRQRYFQLYDGLCGMTGTAWDGRRELREFYRLPMTVIPTRKPCRRKTLPPRFYADAHAKRAAMGDEIRRLHQTRQPVLVGTASIAESERLAAELQRRHVPFRLLNGKQDAEEAEVVARAGELGAITIATNMAGRGTDIRLAPGVVDVGGLHVMAGEPQESLRVDRQLMGRAARQGDPGSYQLFVSAEDRLISRHAPGLARRMRRLAETSGETRVDLASDLARVQRRVQRLHYARRRELFAHDDWLESVLGKLAGQS